MLSPQLLVFEQKHNWYCVWYWEASLALLFSFIFWKYSDNSSNIPRKRSPFSMPISEAMIKRLDDRGRVLFPGCKIVHTWLHWPMRKRFATPAGNDSCDIVRWHYELWIGGYYMALPFTRILSDARQDFQEYFIKIFGANSIWPIKALSWLYHPIASGHEYVNVYQRYPQKNLLYKSIADVSGKIIVGDTTKYVKMDIYSYIYIYIYRYLLHVIGGWKIDQEDIRNQSFKEV